MNKKSLKSKEFTPIGLSPISIKTDSATRLTATVLLRGKIAEEFEAMVRDNNLNRSQLLTQMVYHCLNRSEELEDLYRVYVTTHRKPQPYAT